MDDRRRATVDARLDALLADAAPRAFPPTPPTLAAGVVEALAARRTTPLGRAPRRLLLLAAALALVALVAAAAAAAVGLPGWRIGPMASLSAVPTDLGADAALGPLLDPAAYPADLADAVPAALGPPDAVRLDGDGVLSLVYAPRAELPEIGDSGVGLILQVIEGDLDRERIEKLVPEVGAIVIPVDVDGADGFWIDGPPHLVRYLDRAGRPGAERTRLVGRTVVWETAGVLHRLEANVAFEDALAIARSVGD